MGLTDEQITQLEAEVQRLYKEGTADLERFRRVTVPDFREQEGMRLQTFAVIEHTDGKSISDLATDLSQRIVGFEKALITGAGGDSVVVRGFLTGNELPRVFRKVPIYAEPDDDQIKVRHVFGVKQEFMGA